MKKSSGQLNWQKTLLAVIPDLNTKHQHHALKSVVSQYPPPELDGLEFLVSQDCGLPASQPKAPYTHTLD